MGVVSVIKRLLGQQTDDDLFKLQIAALRTVSPDRFKLLIKNGILASTRSNTHYNFYRKFRYENTKCLVHLASLMYYSGKYADKIRELRVTEQLSELDAFCCLVTSMFYKINIKSWERVVGIGNHGIVFDVGGAVVKWIAVRGDADLPGKMLRMCHDYYVKFQGKVDALPIPKVLKYSDNFYVVEKLSFDIDASFELLRNIDPGKLTPQNWRALLSGATSKLPPRYEWLCSLAGALKNIGMTNDDIITILTTHDLIPANIGIRRYGGCFVYVWFDP